MTTFSEKFSGGNAINITKFLAQKQCGLGNFRIKGNTDFRLSRLRRYNHPIVIQRDQYLRKKVRHSGLYAYWTYNCKFSECPGNEYTLARSRADGWLHVINSFGDDLNSGKEQLQQISVEHNSIVDFAWMPNDLKLVSGSVDGKLTFWHINSPYTIPGKDIVSHKYAVRTISFSKHQTSMFASGGQIGEVFFYDCRSGAKPIYSIESAHEEVDDTLYYFDEDLYYGEGKSVTGLAFQNNHTLFSCTFGKRIIKAWDLRQLKMKFVDKPEYKYSLMLRPDKSNLFHGFTSLSIDPSGQKLYARCSNGSIYSYDISTTDTYFPAAKYKAHDVSEADYPDSIATRANLSPDGKYLICGSNSDTAYIWNTNCPGKPIAKLTSPGDVIKSVDWSRARDTKIATYMEKNYVTMWQDEIEVNKKVKEYM